MAIKLLPTLLAKHIKMSSSLGNNLQKRNRVGRTIHLKMKSQNVDQVIGIPVSSVTYAAGELKSEAASTIPKRLYLMPAASFASPQFQKNRKHPLFHWMNKFKSKANSYAKGVCDHVSLGSDVSQTVKGKLRLGMKVFQAGGVERIFRQNFSVKEGEKLLISFQCYLSTTAGPVAGLLFISSENIAFHSNRYIKITSPLGETARVPYKVLIPLSRTKRACQSENRNKPSQKYIQIVTEDEFEFWFMGFLCHERSFKFLQKAISELPVTQLSQSRKQVKEQFLDVC